jgi:hypothetical protein
MYARPHELMGADHRSKQRDAEHAADLPRRIQDAGRGARRTLSRFQQCKTSNRAVEPTATATRGPMARLMRDATRFAGGTAPTIGTKTSPVQSGDK